MKNILRFVFVLLSFSVVISCAKREKRLLVFSKTEGFRHASIESGIIALQKMGLEQGFKIDTTEDATYFTEKTLQQYSTIIFLNTTGDVLDDVQQADFERYIQAGGGFVGIHAATDTEYDWKWFNQLVGAQFDGHPKIQEATLKVLDKEHLSTKGMEDVWTKTDEWYNFKNINPDVRTLIEIDEESYEGGTHDGQHSMSWYHEFDGGRAFYTGMGHTDETFEDSKFLKHLLGGIEYAIGENQLDYNKAKTLRVPEENRFVKEVLDFNLDEPMELDEVPDRGILFIERRGGVKLYDFAKAQTKKIAQLNVRYENEDGLLGVAVDPNFQQNNWIYLFYSVPSEKTVEEDESGMQHISRFDMIDDSLILDSEKVLLEIPIIRKCCHSGGGLEFGVDGLLYIGLGDNTNPFESSGYAPIDERAGRQLWDAQKSAANTNDLRGKILRIKPEDDGTYSIPKGNLFPEGTEKTRPEIYVMGCRNPFRFSIDSKTGFLYWGDVGPDAGKPDSLRGPDGMGEFDQARKAGFWGWPYTRGNNEAYGDYNFATEEIGEKFNPQKIINDSPNNTGLKNLPPIQESLIWYPYGRSEEFPWLGKGGINPMGGMVFHSDDYPNAKQTFPKYFENKLFVYEWMRDWVYVVTLDENQNYMKGEAFMPNTEFSHPMDMIFGSDGNLYVLEYGQKWNAQNMDARLNRISYIEGNRKPIAVISTDREVGAAPLTVQFSATDSKDYDDEKLTYEWSFDSNEIQSSEVEPKFTFTKAGIYHVKLKVIDAAGESVLSYKKIIVGNDPPVVKIKLDSNGGIYHSGKKVNYNVIVEDTEDGKIADGSIDASKIKVTLNYIPEGKDLVVAALGHQVNTVPEGLNLINESDCKACHAINEKVNGPSYMDVAMKYSKEDKNEIVSRVIKGSSGIWGETMMSAHPQLKIEEVEKMVNYILSLKPDKNNVEKSLPTKGVIEFKDHLKSKTEGIYVLMASYLDEGNPNIEESALSAREQIIFNPPKIEAEDADERTDGLGTWDNDGATLVGSIAHNSFLKFNNISFTNLKGIKLAANYNADYHYKGTMQIREGSVDGNIIGTTELEYFDKKKSGKKKYSVPVSPTIDQGDLYLVFKNTEDEQQYALNANWILLEY